ncbi:V-type ATP synthase subunit E [Pseudoflavonifractor phocaeensis]|uniref:V-type ATP synthase subunit E n=1 Tax=Pseudoflavonifractor phocaeensis TaxID=1870988 RepID=UPI00195739E9|nr:V-type ATP synthase subunit E family protein [Pseudoflavonifractor phocaeensis]MBM6925675.1 hypothetical protein [Pseudoflavonifractor phocaeensis]
MDGIEKITGRIAADGAQEAQAILDEARAQAEAITARYEAQAQRESEEILARGRRNADERVERLASVAQLDARKLELAAKQEMLSKAYDLALEQLVNLPDKEYVKLLADLAVKASVTGKEAVIFSQKDRTRYGKQVVTQANERLKDGHLTMSEQSRPIQGGLILSDGDVEVNCTFETLVRLQRGEMDREVAKVLFD